MNLRFNLFIILFFVVGGYVFLYKLLSTKKVKVFILDVILLFLNVAYLSTAAFLCSLNGSLHPNLATESGMVVCIYDKESLFT